jgi:oligopeptide/dipeptide ABC transporter ATP-binding protein
MTTPLLVVDRLQKHFPVTRGLLSSKVIGWIKAVDGVSFTLQPGETFSLVGESGCGKTTTAKVILRLEPPTTGRIQFRNQEVTTLAGEALRAYRTSVQALFQDPYGSLNPRMRISTIVGEPLLVNRRLSRRAIPERVQELLTLVGLSPRAMNLYPHEFSGGQRQRIALARALALSPQLLVLDEPVSALDVSIRAQIMNLLRDLQQQLGLAYLMIAHHLATVRYMSHRVGVMYLGKLVEEGPAEALFAQPLHPYTQALLAAALPAHPDAPRRKLVLTGEVPSPLHPPTGCYFHPRCPHAKTECSTVEPPLQTLANGRRVACHLYTLP